MAQTQITQNRYEIIMGRYKKFVDSFHNPNQEPVKVFDPLTTEQLEELQMIRELSRELQAKKEEDMRKVAEAKKETQIAAEEKEKEPEEDSPIPETKKEDKI